MRGLLAMLLLLTAVTALARADTTWVEGGPVSGQWTADHSPYIVQGSIHVPATDSLHIGPGVRVYFDGPYGLEVEQVATFSAIGTPGDSIVFTTDPIANPDRWRGFLSAYAWDTLRFDYCIIEFAGGDGSYLGVCCSKFSHTTLRHNRTSRIEGGFRIVGGYTEWTDCIVADCASLPSLGSVSVVSATARFIRCRFERNTAVRAGALCVTGHNSEGSAFLADCVFLNNSASGSELSSAGALSIAYLPTILRDCTFIGNTAALGGAIDASSATLEDCRFQSNTATAEGGAIRNSSVLQAVRCVFLNNCAVGGGAISLGSNSGTESVIDHCTFSGNSASQFGAAVSFRNTSFGRIRNSIIAGCSGSEAVAFPAGSGDTCEVRFSDFFANAEGNFDMSPAPDGLEAIDRTNANGDSCDGFGNLYLDPLFENEEAGDVHLTTASPCIDAADPAAPRDPDSTISDMGAFHTHRDPAAVESKESFHPQRHALQAPYPNPFNATTVIPFDVAVAGTVSLKIVDLLGREVAVLVNQPLTPGAHRAVWTAHGTPSGLYLAVLESGTSRLVRKLMLVK